MQIQTSNQYKISQVEAEKIVLLIKKKANFNNQHRQFLPGANLNLKSTAARKMFPTLRSRRTKLSQK